MARLKASLKACPSAVFTQGLKAADLGVKKSESELLQPASELILLLTEENTTARHIN